MCLVIAHARRAALLLAAVAAAAGCSSIKSRLYDSNGCGERDAKCLHGIPVTLDVPTHVKITVVETNYVRVSGAAAAEVAGLRRTRGIEYDLVRMKELYTVDFKRPAAGTNDLKLSFAKDVSGGQYFSKVEQSLEDVTIDKVTGLIQAVIAATPTLASLGKVTPKGDTDQPKAPGLYAVPSVIAVEFFDIRHPNLSGEIQAFLEQHINACSPCPAGAQPGCPAPGPRPALPAVAPGVVVPAPGSVPVPGPGLNPVPVAPARP